MDSVISCDDLFATIDIASYDSSTSLAGQFRILPFDTPINHEHFGGHDSHGFCVIAWDDLSVFHTLCIANYTNSTQGILVPLSSISIMTTFSIPILVRLAFFPRSLPAYSCDNLLAVSRYLHFSHFESA